MDDIIIKVDTATLKSVSGDTAEKIRKAQSAFEDMENIIKRTADYWEGKGQARMQEAYRVRSDDYQRIFAGLQEHIGHLLQIAGIYEAEERNITQAVSVLPGDIID